MKARAENLKTNSFRPEELRGQLLDWYDKNHRVLPWRAMPGGTGTNPYHVWLSEVMLQQTTVAAVIPYYTKFLEIWPTIQDLAAADLDDVLKEWAGLGYYSRARNLYKCANVIVNDHDGEFPSSRKALKALPGIGEYTSAAIKAIAFNQEATVVDGNIERVMSRLHHVDKPMPEAKKELKDHAQIYFQDYHDRPGDFAQALMDLGATICIPKAARCFACPVSEHCEVHHKGLDPSQFPVKAAKKSKPQKKGYVFFIENESGQVLIQKRPEKGMLAGMKGFPVSEWIENKTGNAPLVIQGIEDLQVASSQQMKGVVRHSFTHFDLELTPIKTSVFSGSILDNHEYSWVSKEELPTIGFPTLFKKCLKFMVE